MKHKTELFVLALFLATILLTGCISQLGIGGKQTTTKATTTKPLCPSPYIEYKVGECCLDQNNNRVCDSDETTTLQTTQATTLQTTQATTVQTTVRTTTQPTSTSPTTTLSRCGQGYYDNDAACANSCPAGQACMKSGKTITYNGQTVTCYQCKNACPTDDPDKYYYYNDPSCGNLCNAPGWYCFESATNDNCYSCGKLCPDGYYYNDSKCGGYCASEEECTKSTAWTQYPCYWCKSPCPEGYYYKDSTCKSQCGIHQSCKKTDSASNCYLCNSECPIGYYYNDPACDGTCADDDICGTLTSNTKCYYCRGPTTTKVTTTHVTTTLSAPVCGNGVLEGSEQCEDDSDCPGTYGYCGGDCKCHADCNSYCADRGINGDGYDVINDPAINTQAKCDDWAANKLTQISAPCFTSCAASAFLSYNGEYCCCADWNSIACDRCPCGSAPLPACPVDCPTQDECMDTL